MSYACIWNIHSLLTSCLALQMFYVYTVAVYSVPFNGEVDCGSQSYMKCHPGYMLQINFTSEICENFGSGSGKEPSCVPLNCSKNVSDYVTILSLCNITYQCTVSCDEGLGNLTYLCNAKSVSTMVVDVFCERGLL